MSLVEEARTRLEEFRTKGVLVALEEKFPKIKEIRGGGGILGGSSGSSSSSGILASEGGILATVREKGVLAILEERFPKVKEMRERGILRGREKTEEYKMDGKPPKEETTPSKYLLSK